jgi:hypothetical protein
MLTMPTRLPGLAAQNPDRRRRDRVVPADDDRNERRGVRQRAGDGLLDVAVGDRDVGQMAGDIAQVADPEPLDVGVPVGGEGRVVAEGGSDRLGSAGRAGG